jgi:glycogen(starch) synthase
VRVWHLAWEYPPLVHGGLGRHVESLVAAQRARGLDVGVLTCGDDVTGAGTAPPPRRELVGRHHGLGGLDVVRVGLGRGWTDVVADAAVWQDAVVAAAQEVEPAHDGIAGTHLLHAHDWMVADAAVRLSRTFAVPWVLTVHATEHGRRQGRLDQPVHRAVHAAERRAVAAADRVIVCSQAMRAEVTDVLGADPSSVVVVPGGVDAAAWSPPPSALASARHRWRSQAGPLVVAAGRLEWEKGFTTLVRALPAVRAQHPAVRTVVAGTGSYRATIEELVASQPAAVVLPGRLDQRELAALMAVADVVVVPSRYEPFGLVALEAMAAGTCVVVTRTGGLAETVQDDATGRVTGVGDVDGLAQTLVELLADQATRDRLAGAGRRAARQRGWSGVATSVLEVYRSVLDSPSG